MSQLSEEQQMQAKQNDVTKGDKSYGIVRTGKQYKLIQYRPASQIYKELDLLRLAVIWLNIITMPIAFVGLYGLSGCEDKSPSTAKKVTVAFGLIFGIVGLFTTIYATIHDPRKRMYAGAFFAQALAITLSILTLVVNM